jgi:hypothetical protein
VKPRDVKRFSSSLLQLLEADPPHEERLLARFDGGADETQPLHATLLYILTHLSFPEPEAKRHWRRALAHRNRLQMELGRDVGLRVAILDYFLNINKELRNRR